MDVRILESADAVSTAAADHCCALLARKPDAVLGLATGRTPRGLYRELVRRHRAGLVDFSRATTFNLDEYLGIAADHPASFHRSMREQLFDAVNLDPARTHLPESEPPDPEAAAARYEAAIREAGGIDLQILGIGRNGHIGFNEPTSSLGSRTRVKTLALSTRRDAARGAGDPEALPRVATTMGIGTILEARRILLLARGLAKAPAVRDAIEGPVRALCPASALQLHADVVVLLDEDAASELSLRGYYAEVARERARLEGERGRP